MENLEERRGPFQDKRTIKAVMKLAVNYSPQAAQLLAEDAIDFDYFKCPEWPNLIKTARSYRPVTVHFRLQAGHHRPAEKDWDLISDCLELTGTYYVNLHLAPLADDFPDFPAGTLEAGQFNLVVERMLEDVGEAVRRFGTERVIVENVPYRGGQGSFLRPAVEPHVIRKILDETGCGLLLDISHARISAHSLGKDEREYMSELPVDRLCELHFTGLHWLDGRLQDHLPILESDWPVLDWVIEKIRLGEWAAPWLLAFEYGGVGKLFEWRSKAAVIGEQVPQLLARIRELETT